MRPWIHLTVPELLDCTPGAIAARLAAAQMARRLSGEPAQLRAWETEVALLQHVLAEPAWQRASIALEYDMLRLEKRIDAVLITDRAIFVLEFKVGAGQVAAADLAQVEDYAQDLWDFHAASHAHPIIPVLVATEVPRLPPLQFGLPVPGVAPVVAANAATLAERLTALYAALPAPEPALIPADWIAAAYKPVPTIIEAAARLFSRNSVADIAEARADTDNLTRTTQAIIQALDAVKLGMLEVDQITPYLAAAVESLNRHAWLPADVKAALTQWKRAVGALKASDILSAEQARQLMFDLESTYNNFRATLK
jgi:hypothetical protein